MILPIADQPTNGAALSSDERYRYLLWRIWDPLGALATWVMLNPSTADASIDDQTIRKVLAFSKREVFGGIMVVNLFALRATDPAELSEDAAPIGPENDEYLRWAVKAPIIGRTIVAWGADRMVSYRRRDVEIHASIAAWRGIPRCLGHTKPKNDHGTKVQQPKHPLFLKGDTPLVDYRRYLL
jgi:hypothetical protein